MNIYVAKNQNLLVNERGKPAQTIYGGKRLPDGLLDNEKIERLVKEGVLVFEPDEMKPEENLPVLPVTSMPGQITSTVDTKQIRERLAQLRAERFAKEKAEAEAAAEAAAKAAAEAREAQLEAEKQESQAEAAQEDLDELDELSDADLQSLAESEE